jgi:hypothetical protein
MMFEQGGTMRNASGIILMGLLAAGSAYGIDIGVTVMQDRLYQPTLDSAIQPTVFLAGVEFGIGKHVGIELRAGYSGFYSWTQEFHSIALDRTWTHGARAQAVPRVHIVAPFGIDWLQLDAGIGLAGLYSTSVDRESQHYEEEYGTLREHEAWSGVQSLIAGARFRPGDWFSFDLEFEHPGIIVSYTEKRSYRIYGWEMSEIPWLADDVYLFRWLGDAKTAIGAGIRFGL